MKIIKEAKKQSTEELKELVSAVSEIIDDVRKNGDTAVRKYNSKFDLNERSVFRISSEEIASAYRLAEPQVIEDIKAAAENIRAFAELQKSASMDYIEKEIYPGVVLGHRQIPIASCCCYVPGGSYPLFSTALMLSIPAKVAGVKRITACSPVVKGTNSIHPLTLIAMDIAGVDEIYAVGGAHAIAAFAYGTDQIKPVDIIVGPGNKYVTEAKRQCYGQVGIDFVAGPSEVLIISDETADPETIGADLLGQSEHDVNARGILITTSFDIAKAALDEVERQLIKLPTVDIARRSWEDNGQIILVDSLEEACNITNSFAPEHLELIVENTDRIIPSLTNYGSLFIGETSGEVFGDYISGTNHTLPTLRASRYTGGVWVGTFTKTCTHQRLTQEAAAKLAPIASRLAKAEGLYAHASAADIRIK